ncbi:uncharacterized protein LOC128801605 isoform X2 [Vidua chalybeata]|uniref:uncharacterized protein LOC128801605 isoform X2 n=1 Tax=Vidua chalybeata TaxID=81927 RepID=UPI0023A83F52|nr:uncharacterized protein LOC128801605 isoform X2 [Vidua chalybeata]
MGGKLSTQQKEIYYQVKVTLTESGKSFSKSFVNKFIKWLILRFPNVSAQDVRKMGFWKHVGAVLTEGTKKGDPSVKKGFMRIFLLVYDMVKEGADSRETREAEKSPSALFPPSPRPPRSENANRCVETSVSNPSSDSFHSCGCSQKCCTPSNPFPRPPRDEPPQDGGGRVAGVFVSSQDGQRSTAETPPSQQSVSEPFMDFVDRVRDTVEKKVEGQEARDEITFEIVTTNANEACRRVIMGLPASPPPTLDQLIEIRRMSIPTFLLLIWLHISRRMRTGSRACLRAGIFLGGCCPSKGHLLFCSCNFFSFAIIWDF